MRKFVAAFFAAGLLFAGAACSDDDSGGGGGDLAATLQEAAAEEGEEISDEEAGCLAEVMVAILGEEEAEAAAAEGPAGIEEAMSAIESGDDPAALGAMAAAMAELDEACLETMGMTPEDIEMMQGMAEGFSGDGE